MRSNVKKLMFRRVLIVGLAIFLQLLVFLATMLLLSDYRSWVGALMTALSAISVLYILYDSSNSSYKISWIILILAFPVAGICIYMAFGGRRLSRKVRERMTLADDIVRENLQQEKLTFETLQSVSDPGAAISSYLYHTTGYPAYDNTETEYFSSGEAAFACMLEELKKAEKYIFLEYFIIGEGVMWEAILEILKEKALRGVDIRVMYDDFGCITTLPSDYVRYLTGWGIRAKIFNPIMPVLSGRLNNRSHRKLLIIDGKVGFTGGINLADEYINEKERFGHWKDCGLCLRGEGVWAMTVMFLAMWDSQVGEKEDVSAFRPEYAYRLAGGEGFVQPYADTPLDAEDVSETLLVSLFHRAVRSIYIMTPYLILDDKITSALLSAARSGVDVRIVTPHVPDKWYVHAVTRAHYEMLTEAGVRIYEYSPGFIHSKVYLVDDRYAVAGTVNLDFRSLYLHFENAVFLYEPTCITAIGDDFRRTFPVCEEITWRKCKNTGLRQRLVRAVLRIFAPLM